jgi:hypothetical protein
VHVRAEASGNVGDLYHGTVLIPQGFSMIAGGIDSAAGVLRRRTDGFTIEYDVGYMAGTHMTPAKGRDCVHFRQCQISGLYCSIGIDVSNGVKRITTTFDDLGIRADLLRRELEALRDQAAPKAELAAKLQQEEVAYKSYSVARREHLRGTAPANFSAEIRRDADLVDYFVVLASYKPFSGAKNVGR